MDFKQLQSFAAVVKYQSFTKAAEMLYISLALQALDELS